VGDSNGHLQLTQVTTPARAYRSGVPPSPRAPRPVSGTRHLGAPGYGLAQRLRAFYACLWRKKLSASSRFSSLPTLVLGNSFTEWISDGHL